MYWKPTVGKVIVSLLAAIILGFVVLVSITPANDSPMSIIGECCNGDNFDRLNTECNEWASGYNVDSSGNVCQQLTDIIQENNARISRRTNIQFAVIATIIFMLVYTLYSFFQRTKLLAKK